MIIYSSHTTYRQTFFLIYPQSHTWTLKSPLLNLTISACSSSCSRSSNWTDCCHWFSPVTYGSSSMGFRWRTRCSSLLSFISSLLIAVVNCWGLFSWLRTQIQNLSLIRLKSFMSPQHPNRQVTHFPKRDWNPTLIPLPIDSRDACRFICLENLKCFWSQSQKNSPQTPTHSAFFRGSRVMSHRQGLLLRIYFHLLHVNVWPKSHFLMTRWSIYVKAYFSSFPLA